MKMSKVGFFVTGVVLTALSGTVAAQTGPYQYYAVTPCRVADTRSATYNSGAYLERYAEHRGQLRARVFREGNVRHSEHGQSGFGERNGRQPDDPRAGSPSGRRERRGPGSRR